MSADHFLDRLEGELLEAARRERSTVKRLRPARWLPPLAATAAAVAALLLVATFARPPVETPPQPSMAHEVQGTWRAGGAILSFDGQGWFMEAEGVSLYGWIGGDRDRLVLHPSLDPSSQRLPAAGLAEQRRCDTRTGTYVARVRDGRLSLKPLAEACAGRAQALAGIEWERAR